MEEMTHKGALTAGLIADYVEKGLVSEDSLIAIALNGELPLVDNMKVAVGESKNGSHHIIILQPKIEGEMNQKESLADILSHMSGINHENVEKLNGKIAPLLFGQQPQEIITSLAFFMSDVAHKCLHPSSIDNFIIYIAGLIKHYVEHMHKKKEAGND